MITVVAFSWNCCSVGPVYCASAAVSVSKSPCFPFQGAVIYSDSLLCLDASRVEAVDTLKCILA